MFLPHDSIKMNNGILLKKVYTIQESSPNAAYKETASGPN